MKLNTGFKGTGTMKGFVAQVMKFFTAINNAKVEVPSGYKGIPPTLSIEGGALVLDMGEASLFSASNVTWDITGAGASKVGTKSATVSNGKLIISLEVSF